MNILIAGGTGFIGRYLVPYFQERGHQLSLLGRNMPKIQTLFGNKVQAYDWDHFAEQHHTLLSEHDLVINLAGATIGEKRWLSARKKILLESRLKTTEALAQACAALGNNAPALFNASAVGVYGLQTVHGNTLPDALDENTPIDFTHWTDFLSEIGKQWETATQPAKDADVRVVNMRFGVVLAQHGGALEQIARPIRFFVGGKIGKGTQPFSWVTMEDLARAIDFLIEHSELNGPVNIVSPGCVTQFQLAKAIGKVLHRPIWLPMPAFILKLMLGQMAEELVLHGQHVAPKKLVDAGFEFHAPTIEQALAHT